jgi:transcriptional regulator with XRE-family HTH domain
MSSEFRMPPQSLDNMPLTILAFPMSQEVPVLARKRGIATRKGMESIGERLTRIRKSRGITQMDMARRLGVTQPIVSSYEKGAFRLHGELIARLAEILRVSTDEILGTRALRDSSPPRSRRAARRLEKLETLSRGDQLAVIRFVNALLKARGKKGAHAASR